MTIKIKKINQETYGELYILASQQYSLGMEMLFTRILKYSIYSTVFFFPNELLDTWKLIICILYLYRGSWLSSWLIPLKTFDLIILNMQILVYEIYH